MTIKIPKSVFDKYYEVVDSTFDIFGVTCQLTYISKVEQIDGAYDNIPEVRSIGQHKHQTDQFSVNGQNFEGIEVKEDIVMKVYWDSKQFTKVGGEFVLPDGAIQTIFKAADLEKVMLCKELLVHKKLTSISYAFRRFKEPFPMGIKLDHYFGCFWERV